MNYHAAKFIGRYGNKEYIRHKNELHIYKRQIQNITEKRTLEPG